jgi:hypothetical protein
MTTQGASPLAEILRASKAIRLWLILAAAMPCLPGCATRDVNPPHARPNTGYVDFTADAPGDLAWQVSRYDEGSRSFEPVYSELKPPQGGILRLAFPPGTCRLQITFLNRTVASPAEIEVQVHDGQITPVRVTLTDAGPVQVPTVERVRGRFGGRYKHGDDASMSFQLSATAGPPATYHPKEQTSYAP